MKTKASLWFMSAALACTLATGANAAVIVMDDTSGNNQTAVQGTVNYTVAALAAPNSYRLSFSLENTSSLGGTRLTGVAFDLLGGSTITAWAQPSGWGFDYDNPSTPANDSPTLPGEAASFDVCWYSGANCGAGGNSGLLETDPVLSGFSVSFTLTGYANAAAVQSAFVAGFADGSLNACVRVISIPKTGVGSGNGSGSDVACVGDGSGPPNEIPEPLPIGLMGLGLAALAVARRRAAAKDAA